MTDAALVRAAQAGDPAALGALLERHRARLHAIAAGMVGHGDAEDAVQDACVIALRRIGDLREPAAARAWLAAIVVNVCRGRLRRPQPERAAAEPLDAVAAAIDRTALRDWVWTALERLPEPLRVAVMLRYFSGAGSYAAIADVCGVPVGTVRSRLSAARARLAEELMATAAGAHTDTAARERRARESGAALSDFERSGDARALEPVFTPAVRFRMFDRVERSGRELLATLLARDFEDGVRAGVARVIAGAEVTIVELILRSPPEQPLHCPPAVTQVHFLCDGRTHRLVCHYAQR